MHNAPSVVFPVGRSRFQGGFLLGLWLTGLLLTLSWFSMAQHSGWRMLAAGLVLTVVAIGAGRGWKNSPEGQLAWNGQVWRWESSGYQAGAGDHELTVIADFQRLLVLRLENQAHASLWLWVERKAFSDRWLDLRRAVYSPHKSAVEFSGRKAPVEAEAPEAVAVSQAMQADLTQTKS